MVKHIRQSADSNHTSLIVSSASSYDEDLQRSMAAGADAFVPKPVEITVLLETLQQQLHLEWIYGEEEPEAEPEGPLVFPPPIILTEMINLARLGDIAAVQQYADDLVQDNPQYAPFTANVQQFTDSFQINQLESFLEEGLDETKLP
jgi:response regulator RpfG family c-di-GMP phosphodiesterase